ncbi:MAG: hypothetical protein EB072_08630, partial [Betaproteobacteria bacterium]|nr:hypothetical protein [Betaproteobacteria bacterium]
MLAPIGEQRVSMNRRIALAASACIALDFFLMGAQAQSPTPIRILVGAPAGGKGYTAIHADPLLSD